MSEQRLENVLRETLQREDAPPDFAAKILARTVESAPALSVVSKKPKWRVQRPIVLALAAALAAMAIIPAAVVDYQRREEARGLKAKEDLLTALAITQNQFRLAKQRVQRTTRNTQ